MLDIKYCSICGASENDTRIIKSKSNDYLCRKHYLQIRKIGSVKRTIYDPNDYIFEENICKIAIYDKKGSFLDYAIIDKEDYNKCKEYKWSLKKSTNTNYVMAHQGNCKIFLHRLILDYDGKEVIDHKNHNGMDNRKSNLRVVSSSVNNSNSYKRYAGVKLVPSGKYQACVWYKYNQIYLGTFDTQEDALCARKEKLKEIYNMDVII